VQERYVLLGLAPARSSWFEALARWSMSAMVAAEFVKCVSGEEVRARLASGRQHSALLIDGRAPAFDRDLVDAAAAAATPVVVVRDAAQRAGSPRELGVSAELAPDFTPDDLLDVLAAHCRPVSTGSELPPGLESPPVPAWQAQLFAVCGPGGTGATTVAVALAQGLAADPRLGRRVLLADLARRADLAMLHDSARLGPGLQELVEAHRVGRLEPDGVAAMTFEVPRRGYRLLLGLRQPEAWAALRPRAIDAALVSLRRSFQAVVADVTGDLEGEAEGGSIDVEERNHLARAVVRSATVTVAVGSPGMKGVHSLARLVRELVRAGAPAERLVAVFNRSPRHPSARAESARALSSLIQSSGLELGLPAALHVPERKLEDALRDVDPLPAALVDPLTRAVQGLAERLADRPPPAAGAQRVVPGSLGSWAEGELEPGA
jgi:MinD-like ATPase involved in chromosome partitioning or flagellar assembly